MENEPSSRIKLNHPPEVIMGNINELTLRKCTVDKYMANFVSYSYYLSQVELAKVEDALQDESWVEAMHDELHQFQRNDIWTLVPRSKGVNIIGTKWIFRNKTNEEGNIIRNKARLVAQGYTQVEGVNFDENFSPVIYIKSVRVLLSLACHFKLKLYQINVKSAFLNGFLKEEVCVAQPKGFVDLHFPNHVFYLKKALYGLKQSSRVWYDHLTEYLVSNGFSRGQADRTLFIKKVEGELVVAQVYVDDIIFESTKDDLAHSFLSMMQTEFKMSMIGELNYFLGLQIRQSDSSIFISQSKYAKNLLKKFGLESASPVRTLMSPNVKLSVDLLGKSVDPSLYSRPDISYSVVVCARYQANPKESHIIVVKHIIKYVKSISNFVVWYDKDTNDVLARYSDADWVGNTITKCIFSDEN